MKSIGLSSKLFLTYGDNVNYYKSIHHPIPTRENRKHPGDFENKSVRLSLQLNVQIYSPLDQTEGETKTFFGGYKKRVMLSDYPQEHLVVIRDEKVSPFLKYEIILPLLCFLLYLLKHKHGRTWSSMINL